METTLSSYLLNEVSNITHDFVQKVLDIDGVRKHDILSFITAFVSRHILSHNIWIYQHLKAYYQLIDTCKKNEQTSLGNLFYGLFHFLGSCEKQNYIFFNETEKSELFLSDIKALVLHSSNHDNDCFGEVKGVLNNDSYTLLHILYDCFMYPEDSTLALRKCFIILRYFLSATPKQYLNQENMKTHKIDFDIIDMIFLIFIKYSKASVCSNYVRDYIILFRDIFYYKIKKKDKKARANFLFYLVNVIINNNIYAQQIDYDGIQYIERHLHANSSIKEGIVNNDPSSYISYNNGDKYDNSHDTYASDNDTVVNRDELLSETPKHKLKKTSAKAQIAYNQEAVVNKCKYLYLLTFHDEKKAIEMRYERERQKMMSKMMKTSTKDVEIDALLARDPREYIHITKLNKQDG